MGLRNFYDTHILPRMIDFSMRAEIVTRERADLIPRARGVVLEIGAGSGLNLPFYGPEVERVIQLEPSDGLRQMAGERVQSGGADVEFIDGSAEDIPLARDSVDTVVCTWVLCSISGVREALGEMRRVLKPDGQVLFVEHGRAPDPAVAKWQDRLTPAWKTCAGGCHLNRRPDLLLEEAGFTLENLDQWYMERPKFLTYHFKGVARKATNGQQ